MEGFNDADPAANENALWLGDRLIPLGRAAFTYDPAHLLAPWRVRTLDGQVDLQFSPFGMHQEQRNFGLVRTAFAQPVGHFDGTLQVGATVYPLAALAGVTESQDCVW